MDPTRFDRLSKRIGAMRLTRRRTAQGLGAAGIAGIFGALRGQPAAADCLDVFLECGIPAGGSSWYSIGSAGVYGQCWNWAAAKCEVCPGAYETAASVCNSQYPSCENRCQAYCAYRTCGRW